MTIDDDRRELLRFLQAVENDVPPDEASIKAAANVIKGLKLEPPKVDKKRGRGQPSKAKDRKEFLFFLYMKMRLDGVDPNDKPKRDSIIDELAPRFGFSGDTAKDWFDNYAHTPEKYLFKLAFADETEALSAYSKLAFELAKQAEADRIFGLATPDEHKRAMKTIVAAINEIEPRMDHYDQVSHLGPVTGLKVTFLPDETDVLLLRQNTTP